jgi:hypothetical protein
VVAFAIVVALTSCGDEPMPGAACTQGNAYDPAIAAIITAQWGDMVAPDAIRVARCESGHIGTSAWDYAGLKHFGLFQMGVTERATYSPQAPDSQCAEVQSDGAHRYFLVAGWRPWTASSACSGVTR